MQLPKYATIPLNLTNLFVDVLCRQYTVCIEYVE